MNGNVETDDNKIVFRVRAISVPTSLASAIAHGIYDGKDVYVRAIGAGAVNQAIKAITIAQGYVASRGMVLSFRPGFVTVNRDGEEVTAMQFHVIVEGRAA